MPSVYDLKLGFQRLLRPSVRQLAQAGATANQVTVAALVLSALVGAALLASDGARWMLALVPLACLARMALNAIDGMLAREHGQQSELGALLNEIGDALSDAALYLPFASFALVPGSLCVVLVVLGIVCELAGVAAITIGARRRYEGPFGKSDRALFFSVLALGIATGWLPQGATVALLWIALLLAAITIWNRCRCALREVGAR